jgi:hypothetical protein
MASDKDCDKLKESMLEVLYQEADEPTEQEVREHCQACSTCREEFDGLRGVRRSLAGWVLPPSLRPCPARPHPAWRSVLAAAAVVLLALGAILGLSGSELRYQDGSFAFRLGRGEDVSALLAQQEQRHQRQLEELKAALLPSAVTTAAPPWRDDEALLRTVRQLIEEGQRRQARALEARMADIRRESEAQRRYDLAQVGASLSYLEGKTGLQMAKTTELMGHVLQASQKR